MLRKNLVESGGRYKERAEGAENYKKSTLTITLFIGLTELKY